MNKKPMNTPSQPQESGLATLVVVSAVQFLAPFMMSSVGIALPAIGREISANAVELGLVETIYILAVALFLLPAGRLGDILGRKKTFLLRPPLCSPSRHPLSFLSWFAFSRGPGRP